MFLLSRYLRLLRWRYRKNSADIRGLLGRGYPDFILSDKATGRDIHHIPVFVFHDVEPAKLRAQLEHLRKNGYRTLRSDELLRVLEGTLAPPKDAVALTFDDGLASLYTVAFPLLAQYDFNGIAFIIPGRIPDIPSKMSAEDEAGGETPHSGQTQEKARSAAHPLCSWNEIQEMHSSGVIDFQSHSMYHQLVHVSGELVDFMHPRFDRHPCRFHVPQIRIDGMPAFPGRVPYGAPIYRAEPRMRGLPRYYEDEAVRQVCVALVAQHGGATFFQRKGWRSQLLHAYRKQKRPMVSPYEPQVLLRTAIYEDVAQSKAAIESRLAGHRVQHFCFPWYVGSKLAVDEARRAGYRAFHWGFLPDVESNKPGSGPLRIGRLDERYILRLPGAGRKALSEILIDMVRENAFRWFKT